MFLRPREFRVTWNTVVPDDRRALPAAVQYLTSPTCPVRALYSGPAIWRVLTSVPSCPYPVVDANVSRNTPPAARHQLCDRLPVDIAAIADAVIHEFQRRTMHRAVTTRCCMPYWCLDVLQDMKSAIDAVVQRLPISTCIAGFHFTVPGQRMGETMVLTSDATALLLFVQLTVYQCHRFLRMRRWSLDACKTYCIRNPRGFFPPSSPDVLCYTSAFHQFAPGFTASRPYRCYVHIPLERAWRATCLSSPRWSSGHVGRDTVHASRIPEIALAVSMRQEIQRLLRRASTAVPSRHHRRRRYTRPALPDVLIQLIERFLF